MNLDDLNSVWCRAEELAEMHPNESIMPLGSSATDGNNGFSEEFRDRDDASDFRVLPLPKDITTQVIDDVNTLAMLPSRIDCSAHEFNSIGRTDSFVALKKDPTYAAQYISVFHKLNGIWKVNSTRLGRETFDRYLKGHKIQKPHRIRWNRIYDAVRTFHD